MTRKIAAALTIAALVGCAARTDGRGEAPRGDGPWTAADGGAASAAFEVEADDGLATLRVPEGALPPGVEPGDIRVRALPAEPGAELAHYELLPDGTDFLVPLEIELRAPVAEGHLVAATLVSGGEVDPVDVTGVVRDEASGEVRALEVSIPHFSILRASSTEAGFTVKTVRQPRDTTVGDTTTIGLELEAPAHVEYERTMTIENADGTTRTGILRERWDLGQWADWAGAFSARHNLDPARSEFGPKPIRTQVSRHEMTFRCEETGAFLIESWIDAKLELTTTFEGQPHGGTQYAYVFMGVLKSLGFCTEPIGDARGDLLGPYPGAEAAYAGANIDLVGSSALLVDDRESLASIGELYGECGRREDGTVVACTPDAGAIGEGPVWVFSSRMAGPVMETDDPGLAFAYGLYLDSDGDPRNDWQPGASELYDFQVGTDRWYQLGLEPTFGTVSAAAMQVDPEQRLSDVASGVRAVVHGEQVTFLVPAGELPSEAPGYRAISMAYDLESDWLVGADVSGSDPTAPLARPSMD